MVIDFMRLREIADVYIKDRGILKYRFNDADGIPLNIPEGGIPLSTLDPEVVKVIFSKDKLVVQTDDLVDIRFKDEIVIDEIFR